MTLGSLTVNIIDEYVAASDGLPHIQSAITRTTSLRGIATLPADMQNAAVMSVTAAKHTYMIQENDSRNTAGSDRFIQTDNNTGSMLPLPPHLLHRSYHRASGRPQSAWGRDG